MAPYSAAMRRTTHILAAGLLLATAACALADAPAAEAAMPPDPAMRERILAYRSGDTRALTRMMAFKRADGALYYLVNAPCCDHYNHLYDGDGRRVCAPTGGFSGGGDGRCPAWVEALLARGPAWPSNPASAAASPSLPKSGP